MFLRKNTVKNKIQVVGGGAVFDPLTFDVGNLLALWDGDNAGVANWLDSVASHSLVYANTSGTNPSVVSGGLNGHDYVQFGFAGGRFSGSYASVVTPVRAQPTTQYFVMNKSSHSANVYQMDDGVVNLRNAIRDINPSPNMIYTSVTSGNGFTNLPAIGTFAVLTVQKQSGALQSSIRTNLGTPQTFTQTSIQDDAGLTLNAKQGGGFFFGDSAWAYIIIRSGIDDLATQNMFVNYLMTRFGL